MLRQIIDQLATDKSRYFPITKFNNCFIIRSPFFFDQLNMSKQSLPARGTYPPFSHKSVVSTTHEQSIIAAKHFNRNSKALLRMTATQEESLREERSVSTGLENAKHLCCMQVTW